jgi:predicted lactoylglutathione lyase
MPRQLFVNLPVKELDRSVKFFTALGFEFNPQFTDENATCMIIGQDCYAMLLVEKFFATFTDKPIADATKGVEVINAIALDSREEVDAMGDKALASGGSPFAEPKDYGFMYQRSFQDPDGHLWEVFYMSGEPPAA